MGPRITAPATLAPAAPSRELLTVALEMTMSLSGSGLPSTARTDSDPTTTLALRPKMPGFVTSVTMPITGPPARMTTCRPPRTLWSTRNRTLAPVAILPESTGVTNCRPTFVPAGTKTWVAACPGGGSAARMAPASASTVWTIGRCRIVPPPRPRCGIIPRAAAFLVAEHDVLVGAPVGVELGRSEPQRDLLGRLLDAARRVDEVPHRTARRVGHRRRVDREVPADRPRRGEDGECRADHLSRDAHSVDPLQHRGDDRRGLHEIDEPAPDAPADLQRVLGAHHGAHVHPVRFERLARLAADRAHPLLGCGVVALENRPLGPQHLERHDLQAHALEPREDLAGEGPLDSVGLDEDERALVPDVGHPVSSRSRSRPPADRSRRRTSRGPGPPGRSAPRRGAGAPSRAGGPAGAAPRTSRAGTRLPGAAQRATRPWPGPWRGSSATGAARRLPGRSCRGRRCCSTPATPTAPGRPRRGSPTPRRVGRRAWRGTPSACASSACPER